MLFNSFAFFLVFLPLSRLIFTVGLFKKVVLADGVAAFVGPVFDVHHASLSMAESCGCWHARPSYLQSGRA